MKKELSPAVAVGIIVVILVVIGGVIYAKTGSRAGSATDKPAGMPADVAAEFQKRLGSANPTGAKPAGTGTGQIGGPGGGLNSGNLLPPK